ncbi:Twitching mobility protein [Anaerohalosphaera lusitana]|uniref:Twitching mobility protein n=1 Tax=Anaerohalosphaera lusitana TaxID=1936003 RepID=A0A1U9NNT9_9BACT|nr:PilT/PilU family type 4a pilus ATPase [Anaerohalosphaera lusitana]AQT69581.1 Twitching mobility protein [Anaerohalosphaera lusitana]
MNIETSMQELLGKLSSTIGASDLILTAGQPPQIRIKNEIVSLDFPRLSIDDTYRLSTSVLDEEQKEKFNQDKELDLSLEIDGAGRFRINMFRQRGAAAFVARSVMSTIPTFEELGLPDIMYRLGSLQRGLVLFTGPVGTGKTTTIASLVNYINQTRACHIVSIEDPIEYIHTHIKSTVNQREVGTDTHSFKEALRRILRQSPDVIVIGEIRDRESAQAAMTLAETGHLTLATLHTRGCPASVTRLVDMFGQDQHQQVRSQLSASLAAVIWQQLILSEQEDRLILATEIMTATPAVRSLIRQGRMHEIYSLLQSGKKNGMHTMEQSIRELISRGLLDANWLNDNYSDVYAAKA